jgi:hypothetical protein
MNDTSFESRQGQENYLFFKMSTQALVFTKFPIKMGAGVLFLV